MPAAFLSLGEAPETIARHAYWPTRVADVVERTSPDVVVFSHWPSVQIDERLAQPTVIDFHGPHMLERAFQGYRSTSENAQEKLAALRKADFFTCAGDWQRHYFLGWILMAGADVTRDVIATVPVSLSPDLPARQSAPEESVFVYGGVFLPWQDPFTGLRTLVRTLEEEHAGRLLFFGGTHPGYADAIGGVDRFRALEAELVRSPRVEVRGLRPHEELLEAYAGASVAFDLMRPNVERELAFTTRTVEYLWCGLPVVYNDYAELAGYIREYEAGWTVDPDDEAAIRAIVRSILRSPEEVCRRGENAQRLVRERLTWERTIEPLDAFVRDPRVRSLESPPEPAFISDGLADEAKPLRQLVAEAAYHWRHGGPSALASISLGFVRKKVRRRRRGPD
jgi:glycosyltransferase involved in cell wall biosynthesis